ncbi:GNAT family N-acetyltransferase [Chitinophaga vietnamensis]|uniref:GNAT family N-acetyltransferase n=1 Tax=Chitinophaga vietnamensis TaxID=2593957 RepID=UPI001177E9FE|nr:GNAT family N-acetyltransferase [Chitinophaga vietnamensis]
MIFRKAVREDLPAIIKMLTTDNFGAAKDIATDPLPALYYEAFDNISRNPMQELIVAEDENGEVVGTLQLTFIQYVAHQGGIRALVEHVRVREDKRGQRIGEKMFQWVIERSREKGAYLVQLTSDKRRKDAIRFYERLGFKDSHAGMKLVL